MRTWRGSTQLTRNTLADDKGSFGRRPSSSNIWSIRRITLLSSCIELYTSVSHSSELFTSGAENNNQEAVILTKLQIPRPRSKPARQKTVSSQCRET